MYQFEFTHPSPLSEFSIGRAVNFIRELDKIASTLQPPDSTPPSTDFDTLFNGGANVDQGHIILKQIQSEFQSPAFRRTPAAAKNYFMCILLLAYHNATHALQAHTAEESSSYMEDARYMLGFLDCLLLRPDDPWDHSWQARKGAQVTNSIYDGTRAEVVEWYKENRPKYKSNHAATLACARHFRIDPRTVKSYVKEIDVRI